VLKSPPIANLQTVNSNAMTTVQTSNKSAKTDEKMPTLRKIKRAAMPTHKPTQIAAHLILPNRTQSPPTTQTTLLTNYTDFFKGSLKYSAYICQYLSSQNISH